MKFTTLFMSYCCALLFFSFQVYGQNASISGKIQGPDNEVIPFANVALYLQSDSSLAKVEVTDENGAFNIQRINAGSYNLLVTYVGFADFKQENLVLEAGKQLDLGVLSLNASAVELETATVTASRALVEIKPDRTVFNVEGTINSAGDNGLGLLRKAPGVLVDNNNNISVLGRSGVLVYVDGKRLPLNGDDLTNYLQNLPAEQIDRIDIITNPGAKYEAEGNAGIIDIRLKKAEGQGANGTVSANYSQGIYHQSNVNASGNFRNNGMNAFGTIGGADSEFLSRIGFNSFQNNLRLQEEGRFLGNNRNFNYRFGTDFFLGKEHTIGFLVSGQNGEGGMNSLDRIKISTIQNPDLIDSVLVANNINSRDNDQNTYNINYRFEKNKTTLNVDVDYGRFRNTSYSFQPNQYFDANEDVLLTERNNSFDSPTDIDIYTFKVDYETEGFGGKIGLGSKLSKVVTDNTFRVFDYQNGVPVQNDFRSNNFNYDEMVYAGYVNYNRSLGEKWSLSAGLRVEQTDATGDLKAFLVELQEPPVELDYINWFPTFGLTYQAAPNHTFSFNYGRRINRPDYNVLNPFRMQLSELSYMKGNPFLKPEIVNNLELGYTLAYRYNFKLAYSRTTDQITRLISPDGDDPRSNFINWDNLASQTIYSLNISAPIQVTKGWNTYINFSSSYTDNQADYGEGAVVDVQAWSYNIYQQSTFDLPKGFKGEVSGWFSGPGVWGGVFKYDPSWSLNLGLQKKFMQDRLNVRLTVNDIFFESFWSGVSEFNGLVSDGFGNWDSRRGSISLSYNFGKQDVKTRNRKAGLEAESSRVGSGN